MSSLVEYAKKIILQIKIFNSNECFIPQQLSNIYVSQLKFQKN